MQLQLVAARHSFSKAFFSSPSHFRALSFLLHTNGVKTACPPLHPRTPPSLHLRSTRPFSSSAPLPRNNGPNEPQFSHGRTKKYRNLAHATAIPEAGDHDPFDCSELERGIERALEKLKEDLGKLRPGGRFNPEVLEGLKVQVARGKGAEGKASVRLGDLAQVIPRGGRTVVVMVGEADHVRPITSAILASPHSLNAVPSPTSPLELAIPVPPPTAESRSATLVAATKAGEVAAAAVQNARAAQKKVLRAIELARTVRPDDLRRAGREMEKVVEGGLREVRGVVEGARKGLGAV